LRRPSRVVENHNHRLKVTDEFRDLPRVKGWGGRKQRRWKWNFGCVRCSAAEREVYLYRGPAMYYSFSNRGTACVLSHSTRPGHRDEKQSGIHQRMVDWIKH
jgi:hypothetical protein